MSEICCLKAPSYGCGIKISCLVLRTNYDPIHLASSSECRAHVGDWGALLETGGCEPSKPCENSNRVQPEAMNCACRENCRCDSGKSSLSF